MVSRILLLGLFKLVFLPLLCLALVAPAPHADVITPDGVTETILETITVVTAPAPITSTLSFCNGDSCTTETVVTEPAPITETITATFVTVSAL
jgi:hypothetical protein